jgi:hypothetical protein
MTKRKRPMNSWRPHMGMGMMAGMQPGQMGSGQMQPGMMTQGQGR